MERKIEGFYLRVFGQGVCFQANLRRVWKVGKSFSKGQGAQDRVEFLRNLENGGLIQGL